jgi:hypothetical protein
MVNFDEVDDDNLLEESSLILFNSFSPEKKLDFFIKLIETNSIIDVMTQFQHDQIATFTNGEVVDENFELIQYVTPDGVSSIICYEFGNIVNINTNNKKEYGEIVKSIFVSGNLLTKIQPTKKDKLKYPYKFYGKYFILNNNEIYSLPMNLS